MCMATHTPRRTISRAVTRTACRTMSKARRRNQCIAPPHTSQARQRCQEYCNSHTMSRQDAHLSLDQDSDANMLADVRNVARSLPDMHRVSWFHEHAGKNSQRHCCTSQSHRLHSHMQTHDRGMRVLFSPRAAPHAVPSVSIQTHAFASRTHAFRKAMRLHARLAPPHDTR